MYFGQNINSQAFRGLDYSNVSTKDRVFIKKEFKELRELGQHYDIRMVSTYANVPNMSAIDVDVKPLKDGLSIIQRILRPVGRAVFQSDFAENKNSLVHTVEEAIEVLGKKMRK